MKCQYSDCNLEVSGDRMTRVGVPMKLCSSHCLLFDRVVQDVEYESFVSHVFDKTLHCKVEGCYAKAVTDEYCDDHWFTLFGNDHELSKFETGAVRSNDADNVRYDLISPIAIEALAVTYAEGAKKYSAFNCEKGFPVTDLLNHALRHIYLFLGGDRSEPHLPHAMWGLGMSIHSYKLWPHLNTDLRGEGCVPPKEKTDDNI